MEEGGTIPGGDLTNTTVFVGGLSDAVTEDMLHEVRTEQDLILDSYVRCSTLVLLRGCCACYSDLFPVSVVLATIRPAVRHLAGS